MEQVLENLLANALRYVPSGGTVELALARVPGRDGRFRLTVSDDGPGLPPEDLAHAFERFYRAAGVRVAGAARDGGGSGTRARDRARDRRAARRHRQRRDARAARARDHHRAAGAGSRFRLRDARALPPGTGATRVPLRDLRRR